MKKNIRLSFIVISWNGLHYVRNLFDSMEELAGHDDIEIILVDNGSEDGTPTFVRRTHPEVILLELHENKGVAYARNRGLEVANGRLLFIIDNDMLMDPTVVYGMMDYMDSHPEVGISGCKLVYGDGTLQESCKKYPGFTYKLRRLLRMDKSGYAYGDKMDGEPFEPKYIIGACQMIRREAFEQTGLLDENIFYGPEDCDYCMRVRKNGWRIMYLPQFTLVHYCQRMTNQRPFSTMALRHIKGLFYLYLKYKRF